MANAILCASGIYAIRNIIDGKFYIGSAVHLRKRRDGHWHSLRAGKHKNTILQRAWIKHGGEAFRFDVLEVVSDKANLIEREQYWMDKERAIALGYNILPTAGNCLGRKHSESTIEKMKQSAIGRVFSAEARANSLLAIRGSKQSPEVIANRVSKMVGVPCSQETKAKISAANTGRVHSAEIRARASLVRKGKSPSAETRAKLSASGMGRIHTPEARMLMSLAQKGIPRSDEQRRKNSEGHKGKTNSPETRRRISAALKGRIQTPAAIEKMAVTKRGKPLSEEHKAKLKASHKGMSGRKHSPETVAKMAATQQRLAAERLIKRQEESWPLITAKLQTTPLES